MKPPFCIEADAGLHAEVPLVGCQSAASFEALYELTRCLSSLMAIASKDLSAGRIRPAIGPTSVVSNEESLRLQQVLQEHAREDTTNLVMSLRGNLT
jgi:hypothetical protein